MYRKFKTLFSISILHNHYQAEKSGDFELIPTADCQQLMRDYGLLLKKFGQQVLVFFARAAKNKSDIGELIRAIDDPVRFSFKLQLNNPFFEGFTELGNRTGVALGTTAYYFSNLDHQTGALKSQLDAEGRIILSQQAHVSSDDLLPEKSTSFEYPVDGNIFKSVEVQQSIIGQAYKEISTHTVKKEDGSVSIDLRVYRSPASGRYRLMKRPRMATNEPVTEEMLLIDKDLSKPGFGYLDIYIDKDNDYEQPKDCAIRFEAAKRHWTYYIIAPKVKTATTENGAMSRVEYDIEYTKSSTESNRYPDQIEFERIEDATMTTTERAIRQSYLPREVFLFRSTEPLPMLDQKLRGLKLNKKTFRGTTEDSVNTLIQNLPNPTLNKVAPDIFVNLKKI